jgi:hypothetical protein
VDRIVFDRNIVALILNEEMDDVMPMLPVIQANRVRNFEIRFWEAFKEKEHYLAMMDEHVSSNYFSRKDVATVFVPTLKNKADAQFVFRMLDGHSPRELLLDHVRKNIVSNVKWDECAALLGM